MKLYNPFKPHLVQFGDGQYGLRQLDWLLGGWRYLDVTDDTWTSTYDKRVAPYRGCKTEYANKFRESLRRLEARERDREECRRNQTVQKVSRWEK